MPPTDPSASLPKVDPKTTFEAAQQELESLIEKIEGGEVGLEESMAAYERGLALLNHCKGILDQAEQKFTDLTDKVKGGG
ncbi:MAG TPA: exodeoxyribonuclease VII small subunit [Phycisphaerales bacterium]|nr:exodeoxyribonuclease VII small subunit [Phycisphaerales bacterium]